jgi:hypothetical protein
MKNSGKTSSTKGLDLRKYRENIMARRIRPIVASFKFNMIFAGIT